jgi:hypothetical protein
MLDRIGTNGINPEDRIGNKAGVAPAQSVTPLDTATNPDISTTGVITDDTQISTAAKDKLAQYQAVKPYVDQLRSQPDAAGPNTARVAELKQLFANGGLSDYLDNTLQQAADGLLKSPEGKTLQASLR